MFRTRNHKQRHDDIRSPNAFLVMLEGRASLELAATLAATPWLRKLPRGNGHRVLVFSGLGSNDFTTLALRNFLNQLGYATHPWGQGFNFGPRVGVLERCNDEVRVLFKRHAKPVSVMTENIEVHASHVGMGMNPIALYAIADRRAWRVGQWKPFDPIGARRRFFRNHAGRSMARAG